MSDNTAKPTALGRRASAFGLFAIIGSAISLLSNLEGFFKLVGWLGHLLLLWKEINHIVVSWLLGWFKLEVSAESSALLTFLFFVLLLAINAYRQDPHSHPFLRELALRAGTSLTVGVLAIASVIVFSHLGFTWGDKVGGILLVVALVVPMVLSAIRSPGTAFGSLLGILLASFFTMLMFVANAMGPEAIKDLKSMPDLPAVTKYLYGVDASPTNDRIVIAITAYGMLYLPYLFVNANVMLRRIIHVACAVAAIIAINEVAKLELWKYLTPPPV